MGGRRVIPMRGVFTQRASGEPAPATRAVVTAVLTIALFLFMLPLLWSINSSLNPDENVRQYPPQFAPANPRFANYLDIWTQYPLSSWMVNSLILCAAVIAGQLFTSSLAGFTFAKLRFRGRNALFFGYVATMLIPSQALLVPVFIIVSRLGLVDSLWAIIVTSLAGAFGTFFFRQFYLGVPDSLIEAARIDGASMFRIYFSVMLPLSRNPLLTLGVVVFLATWNSFLWPLVLLRSPENFPVTVGLASMAGGYAPAVQWHLVVAANITAMVPVLLVFALAQKYVVRGLTMSSGIGK